MEIALVTGASGFIGYHLCNFLARKGLKVFGIDIKVPQQTPEPRHSNFQLEIFDFRDSTKMSPLLRKTDIVFHLASAHLQINLPEEAYWDVNVRSIGPLLTVSRENGVKRFVHVSTVGIYGNLHELPANENTPPNPQSIYGETKIAGENEIRKFSVKYGFSTVILRPAWVYGPNCPRTLKIYRALRKKQFLMIGRGANLRHPIYVEDILDAFNLVMENGDLEPADTFLIGGESAITTNELVSAFCQELDLPRPLIRIPLFTGKLLARFSEHAFRLLRKEPLFSRRSLEFFETNNAFDIHKARTKLGFHPVISFEQGLRRTRPWLESQI